MSLAQVVLPGPSARADAVVLDVVVPEHNEEADLGPSVRRLAPSARVVRGRKRQVISRCYHALLRGTLRTRLSDARCGFKATGIARLGRALATGALPLAALRAQLGRAPLAPRVAGVPGELPRQLVRFAGIGVASTLTYLVLYLALRGALTAQAANLVAGGAIAVANTAANRRLTFGLRGRRHAARAQIESLVVLGLGLALTSAALTLLPPTAGRAVELGVLVTANFAAALLRFLLLRAWVFHPRRG